MSARHVYIILGLIAFTIASCTEIAFPVAQPKRVAALKEIPQALHGRYGPPTFESDSVTLIIDSKGYYFDPSNEKSWLDKGMISDSLVVKFYRDYYFFNFRIEDVWCLRVVKQLP